MNRVAGKNACLNLESVDADVVRNVALFSDVELQPFAAFFGGLLAQEVVKLTGKFSPLSQMLYHDCFEVLPESRPMDVAPRGSRYDDHISMFGVFFVVIAEYRIGMGV